MPLDWRTDIASFLSYCRHNGQPPGRWTFEYVVRSGGNTHPTMCEITQIKAWHLTPDVIGFGTLANVRYPQLKTCEAYGLR